MSKPLWHDDLRCPDCHSGMRADGYNRNGWWRADCGRRYSPSLKQWDHDGASTACLRRRLETANQTIREMKRVVDAVFAVENGLILQPVSRDPKGGYRGGFGFLECGCDETMLELALALQGAPPDDGTWNGQKCIKVDNAPQP